MIFNGKIRKIGSSNGLLIPIQILNFLNIKENDLLDLRVENGKIIINKKEVK